MESFVTLGFRKESFCTDAMYEDVDLDPQGPGTCGECEDYEGCDLEGHKGIGWCKKFSFFTEKFEEACW